MPDSRTGLHSRDTSPEPGPGQGTSPLPCGPAAADAGYNCIAKNSPRSCALCRSDPWRNQQWINQLSKDIQASGASFEFFEYPVDGRLFTDPGVAEYDAEATSLLRERAAEFIAKQG